MANLMVTGGAGFIGVNFVQYWVSRYSGDRVVVLDALTYAGNIESLRPVNDASNYRFVKGDIRDSELIGSLLEEERIDTIVHFAAESHVDRSIQGPDAFIDTNVVGTHCLLKAAREAWLDADDAPMTHRFHHVSTDEVYGSLQRHDAAFSEATPYAPNSPYSASKAASDHLVRAYHHTYGLDVTTSNCSNNYGPYQFPEKLIPLMFVNALEGKALPVYGDGTNIRDWLFVTDHVRAIDLIIHAGISGETYNVGGNEERANIDIVNTICEIVDRSFSECGRELAKRFPNAAAARGQKTATQITRVKDRPGHDWRYAIDASKIQSELGFVPECELEQGLLRTYDWMLENENWWRSVIDGSYRDWIDSHYSTVYTPG